MVLFAPCWQNKTEGVSRDRTTDAMFAVALPQNERLRTRSFRLLGVSRFERGPSQQSISK